MIRHWIAHVFRIPGKARGGVSERLIITEEIARILISPDA